MHLLNMHIDCSKYNYIQIITLTLYPLGTFTSLKGALIVLNEYLP